MRELPFPPGTKFVGYFRDSGGSDQELSVDQQIAEVRALANRQGYIITREFTDRARSGKSSARREQFHEMRNYLIRQGGSGEAGVLLWSYSRFYRRLKHFQFYVAEIEIAGYKVVSLLDDVPDTPEGEVMRTLVAYSGERQVLTQGDDIRRGLRDRAYAGGAPSGKIPAGFRAVYEPFGSGSKRDGSPRTIRRLAPDPESAPLVQRAFQLRAAGYTIPEIHNECHLYNYFDGYRYMLRNPIYIGIRSNAHGEIVVPGAVEPLIDRETWDKVQQLSDQKRARFGPSHPRRAASGYLLTGVLRCGLCGRLMTGNTHTSKAVVRNPTYSYVCPGTLRYLGDCRARSINARRIEDQVFNALREFLIDPALSERVREELSKQDTTSADDARRKLLALRAEIAELNKALDNLYHLAEIAAYATDDEALGLRARIGSREAERRAKLSDAAQLEAALPAPRKPPPENVDGALIWAAIERARTADRRAVQLLLRAMLAEVRAVSDARRRVTGSMTIKELPQAGEVSITVSIA